MSDIRFAFFGTDSFAQQVCESLVARGFTPELVITAPDRPVGRKLVMTPPPMALWAKEHDVALFQPERLDDEAVESIASEFPEGFDVFVVASYGKIIPQAVLDIPKAGCLNVHPSLLPRYRGASPLEFSILADERSTGVTVIEMDAKMDHGPIVATHETLIDEWPARPELETRFARIGGELVADVIEPYVAGRQPKREQDHAAATFTRKIAKADAEIDLAMVRDRPREAFLRIQAYAGWPNAFFFVPSPSDPATRLRVVVKAARFESTDADRRHGTLAIERVVPEGSTEMDWESFARGYLTV